MKFQLTSIIEPHISNGQHGFRSNRSVTTNLMNLSIRAYKAFERSKQLDVFYGDFKSAFDRVCHRLLVTKLSKFSVGERTAKWIYEFIKQNRNYVQIGENKSRTYTLASGVPPGSTLGPILFSIFINDVTEVVQHANVLLFADDIKLMMEIGARTDTYCLQEDLNRIGEWCKTNCIFFNEDKCAIFTAYRTKNYINGVYMIADKQIQRKQEIRDLGILLDHRLSFAHHIEQLTAHARQLIGYIKRVSNGKFTKETQKTLYLAYVRSKLEFASVIWSPYLDVYKSDI